MKDIVEAVGNFLFVLAQVGYWVFDTYYFTPTIAPLFLALAIRLVVRSKDQHQCHSFSNMVRFTQLFFFGRWFKLATLACLGLKLDGLAEWGWHTALWPVWLGLGFLFLLSIGLLLLFLGSISSYISGEADLDEIVSLLWLFVSGAGTSSALGYYLYALLRGDPMLYAALPAICFFSVYLAFVLVAMKFLVRLCEVIMLAEDLEVRSPVFMYEVLKKTPVFLMKLSSTFFREVSAQELQEYPKTKDDGSTGCSSAPVQQFPEVPAETTCAVCYNNPSNAVLMNCRHGGLCLDCAVTVWQKKSSCHLCRKPISQVLEITSEDATLFKVVSTTRIVEAPNS